VRVRLARLLLEARDALLVGRRLLEALERHAVDVGRLEHDLDRLLFAVGEREPVLELGSLAVHVALRLHDVVAGIDGDALPEQRLADGHVVERDLDARGVGREEELHVGDAREEIGDPRLGGLLEVVVVRAERRAERVLRLVEGIDDLARALQARREM